MNQTSFLHVSIFYTFSNTLTFPGTHLLCKLRKECIYFVQNFTEKHTSFKKNHITNSKTIYGTWGNCIVSDSIYWCKHLLHILKYLLFYYNFPFISFLLWELYSISYIEYTTSYIYRYVIQIYYLWISCQNSKEEITKYFL